MTNIDEINQLVFLYLINLLDKLIDLFNFHLRDFIKSEIISILFFLHMLSNKKISCIK